MKWFLTLIVNLSLLWLANAADAPERKDFTDEEFTCPIDGHRWKQRMEGKGRPAGLRLDLKLVGDVIQPSTAPHCPKCGMVLFKEKFPDELVRKLKPFILSPDYQLVSAKSPVYAKLAVIQEFLGAGPIFPAYSYLKASWETENKPAQHQRYLAKALEYFTKALAEMQPDDKEWLNVMVLCGELDRRLEHWSAAEARFQQIATNEQLKEEKRLGPVVKLQLKLIASRNSMPQIVAELPDAKVKPIDELKYAPMAATERKPKRHLRPEDMHESLVMNVEEPPLPQTSRRVRPLPNPPVEALGGGAAAATEVEKGAEQGSASGEAEPVGSVFPEIAALPAPKPKVRRPKTDAPKATPKPVPTEVVHKAPPTPKPEPKEVVHKAPPAPKPEPKEAPPTPKPEPKEVVQKMPPAPKPEPKAAKLPPPPKPEPKAGVKKTAPPPEPAVLAPQGEKKTRPKLIGDE